MMYYSYHCNGDTKNLMKKVVKQNNYITPDITTYMYKQHRAYNFYKIIAKESYAHKV